MTRKRAPDRSPRDQLTAPDRPKTAHRTQRVWFWQWIEQGITSDEAAVRVAASAPVCTLVSRGERHDLRLI